MGCVIVGSRGGRGDCCLQMSLSQPLSWGWDEKVWCSWCQYDGCFQEIMSLAPHFTAITPDRMNALVVVPPYESKTTSLPWVRGSIRIGQNGDGTTDLVVTGPKLKVVYSGCRWNRIVFALTESNEIFEQWLRSLAYKVETMIWAHPDKFKPGAKDASRFVFDLDVVRPSSDPALYPDELRVRLATYRKPGDDDPDSYINVVNSHLFMMDEAGQDVNVDPSSIQAGGFMTPIFKVSYFRNLDRFGLVLTVLKGMYIPPNDTPASNKEWVMDTSTN